MTSGQFHTWHSNGKVQARTLASQHRSKPTVNAPVQAKKKRGKRTPNYANPQDEYILILLEYKLMPWLSGWTFWQEWVDRTAFTFFLHEVPLSGTTG